MSIKNIKGNGPDEFFIKDVQWFKKEDLQNINVFPENLKDSFWQDLGNGFSETKYLGRQD